MTSFIWDTENYLGRTDQTFDLSQMWPQQVANRFCSECGALQTATVMANQEKKVPFDPKVFLATVNGGRSISKYRMHQKVFSQGNPADAVFHYIQKGNVKITVVSERGKEAVVAILGPDEFCGEGCLTGQRLRLATSTAVTDCEIMRLEKATRSASSMRSQPFPSCSSHTSWRALSGLKRTWCDRGPSGRRPLLRRQPRPRLLFISLQ
jgi:hypothetical protein